MARNREWSLWTRAERIAHAVRLVKQGMSVDIAGLRFSLMRGEIQAAIEAEAHADQEAWRNLGGAD